MLKAQTKVNDVNAKQHAKEHAKYIYTQYYNLYL